MNRKPILLLGAGGHARACIDVVEQEGRFIVAGLVGLPAEVGSQVFGYPVLGADEDLATLVSEYKYALIAVGQIKTAEHRIRIFKLLEKEGCNLPTIISPRSYVSAHAKIGAGTIVMHGAIINAGAIIGRNCIVNSQALVEHDCVVADHCHIATSASINSGVQIGAGTFVGSNTSVKQGLRLGEHCVIGMGQQVLEDCRSSTWIPQKKAQS